MNNAEHILRRLDHYLTKPVELVIYGRASLALGFDSPLREHLSSADVDAVISITELNELQNNEEFWDAQASVNAELEKDGLYFTHIFTENDVIIREGWEDRKVPINMNFQHLKLYRPATEDLILTKMMRDDPQDLADIKFMMTQPPIPLVCCVDKAAIRLGHRLKMLDRFVALDEMAREAGNRKSGYASQYTKAWLAEFKMAVIMGILR